MMKKIEDLVGNSIDEFKMDHATGLELIEILKNYESEKEKWKNSFDIRWKADMRAIKRWQKENPGNDLTWPDHADMCVWLMGKLGGTWKKSVKVGDRFPNGLVAMREIPSAKDLKSGNEAYRVAAGGSHYAGLDGLVSAYRAIVESVSLPKTNKKSRVD